MPGSISHSAQRGSGGPSDQRLSSVLGRGCRYASASSLLGLQRLGSRQAQCRRSGRRSQLRTILERALGQRLAAILAARCGACVLERREHAPHHVRRLEVGARLAQVASSAPSAVVRGGGIARPRRAAARPASRRRTARTPRSRRSPRRRVICPARYTPGARAARARRRARAARSRRCCDARCRSARSARCASPGISANTRRCSGCVMRVWKPTRLYAVPSRVLAPQLHHGVRPLPGARIGQPDRLHRPERQRLLAALGHHLDRQAALEVAHAPRTRAAPPSRPRRSAATNAWYCASSSGQFTYASSPPLS